MADQPPRTPPDGPEAETVVDPDWAVRPESRVVERTEVQRRPPRRPLLWPWLLALLLLVLGGLGAAYLLTRDEDGEAGRAETLTVTTTAPGPTTATAPATATVPDVVGRRFDEAAAELEAVGLKAARQDAVGGSRPGVVLRQDPAAGAALRDGGTVTLTVSRGRELARVPEVVGMTSSRAAAALRDAGLDVTLVPVPSDQPAGTVVAQNPPAGAEAPRGSAVRLNVAQQAGGSTQPVTTEAQPATVPDVVGQELARAARSFARDGLQAAVQYVPSSEPQGRVVAQAQPAGTERRRGDTVQLNVSTGEQPAAAASVPRVVGRRQADARQALEQAGFEVLAIKLDGRVRREDRVATQSPAGGASVPTGSLVLLYVVTEA